MAVSNDGHCYNKMLNESQRNHLIDLFDEGVKLGAEERATFVLRSCEDDPVIRDELAELLNVEQTRLDGFLTEPVAVVPQGLAAVMPLDTPAGGTSASNVSQGNVSESNGPHPHRPPHIDGYTDFEPIAVGGMGAVYRAQQLHPVRRTVAIKVIRIGMDSDTMLARFAAERQALALMSHPYIAAVHDAGTDAMGRPFIAMEFADGEAITDFCNREQLSLTKRLQLFAKVCHAVDHAHRRGVLHRDLKPSNVLVCRSADELHPKVIDFGIAKAIEGSLGEHSLHTQVGSFLGTPEYMSPEQLDGAAYSIDTRSDVYSLGVMLYELVSLSRPIDPDRLSEVGLLQLTKIIREEVPPKPSTRLRALLADETTAPQVVDSTRWLRRLHGDLDWIVMKALDKDPDQRYGSAHELASDLECYLTHMPVTAGPPSGLYRLRKFTRRYRVHVIAAMLVLLSLVIGLFGTVWFLFESQANERAAEQRARDAEGSRIAAQAVVVAADDPNLAMLLALEARQLTGDHSVDQTVLDVLPLQDMVGRFDHYDHAVRQALFLPDGRLLSRCFDSVVLLTDPDRGAVLRRFVGHEAVVTHIAVSPDANLLLTTCDDGTARVWDIETGACQHCFADHFGRVVDGAFSSDGRLLATAGSDGVVRLYDVGSGSLRHVLGDHENAVASISFDPSGRRLASQSCDRTTRIWDTATGGVELLIPPGDGENERSDHTMVRFSREGDRIVRVIDRGRDQWVMQCYTDAGDMLSEIDGAELFDGPLGDPLMVRLPGALGTVSLQTGQLIASKPMPAMRLLELRPEGKLAVAVDAKEDLCIVDLELGRVTRKLSGRSDKRWTYLDVAFHPDGQRFAVTGSLLRMWTWTPEFAPFRVSNEDSSGRTVSLAAAAEALALVEHPGEPTPSWSLWSLNQRRVLRHLQPEGVQSLRLSECATRLIGTTETAAADGGGARIRTEIFDLAGQKLHELAPAIETYRHVVSPDGRMQLIVTNAEPAEQIVSVFDMVSGEQRLTRTYSRVGYRFHSGAEHSLLTESFGGRSRTNVIDINTGRILFETVGPGSSAHYGAAVDPLGQRLLVVLGDLRARVYDLKSKDLGPIAEYAQIVRSNQYNCGFVAGGDLAWVSCANEVHLFESATGKTFAVLRLGGRAQFVVGASDGSELHTISNGAWQRWPLAPVASAQRLVRGSLSRRTLDLYRIGSTEEREARELQILRAKATPRSWAQLGEHALRNGDLDEAIRCYQQCSDLGPLIRQDLRRYLRLLELRCRRLAADDSAEDQRIADRNGAFTALQQALRCGVSADQLRDLPSIEAVRALPEFRGLIPE